MNNEPTPAALRAVASVFDRFFNIPAKATPEELALLVDAELEQERERARELEAALARCVGVLRDLRRTHGENWNAGESANAASVAAKARAVLAKLRADREGRK
jgi:hypothetical protein